LCFDESRYYLPVVAGFTVVTTLCCDASSIPPMTCPLLSPIIRLFRHAKAKAPLILINIANCADSFFWITRTILGYFIAWIRFGFRRFKLRHGLWVWNRDRRNSASGIVSDDADTEAVHARAANVEKEQIKASGAQLRW
jgi:hypothetical protein